MPKNYLKFSLVLAMLLSFFQPQAAQAVASGTVTVVGSGGAAENSNWTYSAGEISPSTSVSINASDIVAKLALGPLTILGDKLVINSSIVSNTANALTFKVTGNILVDGGVTIQTQGGNIVFNSDSDSSSAGFVRFGVVNTSTAGAINSNGGDIIVGGGSDPLASPALANNTDNAGSACGGTPPVSGVGIYSFTFNSGNGNIKVRGGSPNYGTTLSVRGINISSCAWGTVSFTASGAGSIYLNGDGSQIGQNNAWGIAAGSFNATTQSGNITIEGRGNGGGPTNARGMSIGGASTFTSSTGNITFLDTTDGQAAGYTGLNIGSAITVTTGGAFAVTADEVSHGGSLTLDVSSATIQPNTGSSFTGAYSVGVINAINADSLTIGKAGNTASITLNSAISGGGPINLYAGALAINAALSSTTDITITASGAVSQTAAITSVGLALGGTGTYTLTNANNNVTTLATGNIASLSYTDANGFSAGNVGGFSGINSSSPATLSSGGQTYYRLLFNSQGGTSVQEMLFASGGSVALPAAPTKAGYSFRGWFTSSSGGTAASSTYTPGVNSDVTLYAQWALIPPPISVGSLERVGNSISISGSNLDRLTSVTLNGQPFKLSVNSSGQAVFDTNNLAPGSYTIVLKGEGVQLTWENAIVVKAPAPVRERNSSTTLTSINSQSLTVSAKNQIKAITQGAVALSCNAYVPPGASAPQRQAALAKANAVCKFAVSVTKSLKPSRVSTAVLVSKTVKGLVLDVAK